jgi:hydrogenase maturation protease
VLDGSEPETIVIGLGNPVLGDDGVGWRVADEVERRLADAAGGPGHLPPIRVERLAVGGIALMETLSGYARAVLIDAAEFPGGECGDVRAWSLDELPTHATGHLDSVHDASLSAALTLGRRLGAQLPDRIDAVTIQVQECDVFGETLSPQAEGAVGPAADLVLDLLLRREV